MVNFLEGRVAELDEKVGGIDAMNAHLDGLPMK